MQTIILLTGALAVSGGVLSYGLAGAFRQRTTLSRIGIILVGALGLAGTALAIYVLTRTAETHHFEMGSVLRAACVALVIASGFAYLMALKIWIYSEARGLSERVRIHRAGALITLTALVATAVPMSLDNKATEYTRTTTLQQQSLDTYGIELGVTQEDYQELRKGQRLVLEDKPAGGHYEVFYDQNNVLRVEVLNLAPEK